MSKRRAGYIAYGIVITIVFLYCRFPDSLIEQWIRSGIAQGDSHIKVSLDSATLIFPLSVEVRNLKVGTKEGSVAIDRLKADLMFGKLLQGLVSCTLEADAYGGKLTGDAGFAERFTAEGPIDVTAHLNTVDIGACSYLKEALNQDIDGKLTGTLTYRGTIDTMTNGTGDANLSLTDGSMGLRQSLLGVNRFPFDTLTATVVLRDRILKINKVEITGQQLNGSFSGTVFLNDQLPLSRVAAKGRVRLFPIEKYFSLTLSGTLARPRHSIR